MIIVVIQASLRDALIDPPLYIRLASRPRCVTRRSSGYFIGSAGSLKFKFKLAAL